MGPRSRPGPLATNFEPLRTFLATRVTTPSRPFETIEVDAASPTAPTRSAPMPTSPPPDLATFAAELTAELAGQGGHHSLLVAEAVAAAVRLKLLFADPRIYLPHTVDRSWDRDHDLASRDYFRAHRALRSARSSQSVCPTSPPQKSIPPSSSPIPPSSHWAVGTGPLGGGETLADHHASPIAAPSTPNPVGTCPYPVGTARATHPPSSKPRPSRPASPSGDRHPRDPRPRNSHPAPGAFQARSPIDYVPISATPRASPPS
jgi:hypothetical protein